LKYYSVPEKVKIRRLKKDITNEFQNKAALQDSESRFRALADSIPGVVFIVEKETEYGVVYLSDNVKTVTGYNPEDFYEQTITLGGLIHPGDVGWIINHQENSYQQGKPYHIEYRMKDRAGAFLWIEEYGAVITKKDGKKYLQGVFFDITERKQAEKELKQSERSFRLIFENTSEIIFSLDTDWQFAYASPAAYKFIGYNPAEMVGKKFLPFVHEDDRELVKDALNFLLISHNPKQNLKYRVRHKEGGSRWHLGAFNPVFSQKGKILHIVGTSKDITESVYAEVAIKEQNQKLKELNEEKDSLLSVVAHDLKSPLDKVKGLAQLISMAGGLNEEQENYLKLIENLTESGVNLIRSLLDLSKLEQNLTKISVKEEDVGKLLKYVVESHSQRAKEKKIDLVLDVPGYYLGAFLDASLVTRCIDNLLSNAIKFSTSFTKVLVKLERKGDEHFLIKVMDEGPGMTPEDQKKIFQKFQKLSAQPTAGESSSGLGLAIVKALVKRMSGSITFHSEVNKGTAFIVELPFKDDGLKEEIDQS